MEASALFSKHHREASCPWNWLPSSKAIKSDVPSVFYRRSLISIGGCSLVDLNSNRITVDIWSKE